MKTLTPKPKINIKKNLKSLRKITVRSLVGYILTAFIAALLGGTIVGFFERNVTPLGGNDSVNEITVTENSAVIDVVDKVTPSVVSITAEQSTLNFFGEIQKSESSGTGFIVTADGLIMTNKHVVEASNAKYAVFTNDGKEYDAEVIATDPFFDIAFIKIDAKNLPVAKLGDSNDLKIGQRVVAIGNALGQFQNTVTTGVVSAIGRAIEAGSSFSGGTTTLENMIQTDAAINPGNSGGPLVNLDGQVIGINTAVASGAEGIGFVTPINIAKTAFKSVQEKGKIVRPMLGVRYINITKEFAVRNNLPVNYGALIYSYDSDLAVLPGTPAAKAGLTEGDIITKIADYELTQGQSLISVLSNFAPGDEVTLTYLRDGKEKTATIVLAESK